MGDFKLLKAYQNRVEAEAMLGLLKNEGIQCRLHTDDYGGVGPHFGFSHGAKLYVIEEQFQTAYNLLPREQAYQVIDPELERYRNRQLGPSGFSRSQIAWAVIVFIIIPVVLALLFGNE